MKPKLLFALIVFCGLNCLAQKPDEKAKIFAQQIILKKQILVDDLDSQAKDVPFADVRVFVKIKLAEWLWKDGKDETGRAELLAVKAFEELYEKKDEFVEPRTLKANLFSLLEVYAKETAQRLRAKYNVGAEEDLLSAFSLLNKKGMDKIVADKVKKALVSEKDLAKIAMHLATLRRQKSPEFLSILFEIIRLHESGINKFSAASLYWISDNFRDSLVPNDLKIRYYKIVLNKARSELQSAGIGEIHFTDLLLFYVLPDMKGNAPALAAEAAAIKLALSAKVPQGTKDLQEREQRINESSNQIEALIAEADKTDNKNLKYSLLDRASRLAAKEEKFQLAVDLIEKTIEEPTDPNSISRELRISNHDQHLALISGETLQKDDVAIAEYAMKKITDDLTRADALRQFASYFIRKKDSAAAVGAYNEAFDLTIKAKDDQSKYSALLMLIGITNAIDRNRVSEITSITARSINKIPTLNVEDKPGTKQFKNYVSTIMRINLHLHVVVGNLSRMNRNEAVIFTNKIDRKEMRIVADLALATSAFEPEKKQILKY